MKTKLSSRTWAKVLAAVLLLVSLVLGGAAAAGFAACADMNYYSETPSSYYESRLYTNRIVELAREIADTVHYGGQDQAKQVLENYYTRSNTNAYIQVYSSLGVCILENEAPERIATRSVREYTFGYDMSDVYTDYYGDHYEYDTGSYEVYERSGGPTEVTVRISLAWPQSVNDGFARDRDILNRLYDARFLFIGVGAAAALLALVSVVFLFCGAGHRAGVEGIVLTPLDKVPLDLLLLGAVCLLGLVADIGLWSWWGLLICAAYGLLCFRLLLSFAVRCKGKCLWSNLLVRKLWKLLLRALRAVGRALRQVYGLLPMLGKSAAVILAATVLELLLVVLTFANGSLFYGQLLVLYNLALLAGIFFGVLQMKRLREAGQRLAGGDFDYKVDTSRMYWEFRRHGENLNSIGAGMAIAVEQRMKSERLKTELITNVSHDIKTPLTSIINYTDLLQRPELTEAERAEYLEVLGRQSRRLKKLTEDLVEASKASTGNIQTNLAPTNVEELINQAVAEYSERLQAGRLEPVVSVERPDLTALADGRLLWRVLDNLLGNAVKYALAGTRVYLDARTDGDRVRISVKNISREPLNISADELMERFVRGDASRTTEGSGLGLNIARSLTALQQGTFDITVDGDLFRADIRLKPGEA